MHTISIVKRQTSISAPIDDSIKRYTAQINRTQSRPKTAALRVLSIICIQWSGFLYVSPRRAIARGLIK